MTKESLAAAINGREYTNEITKLEAKQAKEAGLVVIFGASDDLIEFEGAIYDECGAPGTMCIQDGKLVYGDIPDDEEEVLKKYNVLAVVKDCLKKATKIVAKWDIGDYSWVIETTAPHAAFDIMDDGAKFCRGIVIDLKELEVKT